MHDGVGVLLERDDLPVRQRPGMRKRRGEALARRLLGPAVVAEGDHRLGIADEFLRHGGERIPLHAELHEYALEHCGRSIVDTTMRASFRLGPLHISGERTEYRGHITSSKGSLQVTDKCSVVMHV